METAISNVSGDISVDIPVLPGAIYRLAMDFPAATTGPSAGTLGAYHHDAAASVSIRARDENGTAVQTTATGSSLGAEFTVVALEKTLRLVGAGLGDSKLAYYSLTLVR